MTDANLCPVPSPEGYACIKKTWPGESEHAGGHLWVSPGFDLNRAHFDATRFWAGQPFEVHYADTCPGPDRCTTAAYGGVR